MFVIWPPLKATAMVSSLTFGALLIRLMITKEQAFCNRQNDAFTRWEGTDKNSSDFPQPLHERTVASAGKPQ